MSTLTAALAISCQNLASGKTITATTSATGFPASNLSNPRLQSTIWRSTAGSLTSQNLTVDLTSSQSYDVVAVLGSNLDDDATRRMFGDDDSGFATPDWDPGADDAFDVTVPPLIPGRSSWPAFGRHIIQFTQTTQTDRYVRVQLSDSGNVDNYLRAAVLWVGLIEQFSFDSTWEPGPWRVYGDLGSQRIARLHTFNFINLSYAQKVKLESLYYTLRESGRMLIVPRPTVPSTWIAEAIYGTFAGPPRATRMLADPEAWTIQVTFVESLD